MNDRELLKLAAKAAGIKCFGPGAASHLFIEGTTTQLGLWSPLTDDGDALRLAVKLRIDFSVYKNSVRSLAIDEDRRQVIASFEGQITDNPYAATRRAIVRAAAEIGNRMIEEEKAR